MADDQQGLVLLLDDVFHPVEAFLLEIEVAHRQNLVDDQDIGVHAGCDREPEADRHAGAVALERRIDELLELGERNDLVHFPADLRARQAEDRGIDIDVLATREIPDEPCAHLDQRGDAAANRHLAPRRLRDMRQHLEERALARAIASDDADHFPRLDAEAHVIECLERRGMGRGSPKKASHPARHRRPETVRRREVIFLRHMVELDGAHDSAGSSVQ